MKKKSIYIIGRMRGIGNFNFTAFSIAEHNLRQAGWSVVNPHAEDRKAGFDVLQYRPADYGLTWNDYPPAELFNVKDCEFRCDKAVRDADAILVLAGGLGEGGRRELKLARDLGKRVFYESNGYPTPDRQEGDVEPVEIGTETGQGGVSPSGRVVGAGQAMDDACELAGERIEDEIRKAWPDRAEVVVVDKDTGGRKGTKIEQCSQIPPNALLELARHYGVGANKYEAHNFRKGYDWSLSYNALQRHLLQFWGGEDIDKETGSKHVVAAAWHCIALATFMDEHRAKDDRYRKVAP